MQPLGQAQQIALLPDGCIHVKKKGLKYYTQRTHVWIFMFYDVALYSPIITVTQSKLLETQSDCCLSIYLLR